MPLARRNRMKFCSAHYKVCVCVLHIGQIQPTYPSLGTKFRNMKFPCSFWGQQGQISTSSIRQNTNQFVGETGSVTPLTTAILLSSKGTLPPQFAQISAHPQARQSYALELMKKICYKLGVAHRRCQKAIKFWLDQSIIAGKIIWFQTSLVRHFQRTRA